MGAMETPVISAHLPWHELLWQQLQTAWQEARWPHALLLYGPQGVGKQALAIRLASALLCDETRDATNLRFEACGICASCKLLASKTHPDLLTIQPEEDKQQISVDQIRESCAQLAMTSYRRGYKVAIIEPAHQMTLSAANSLLKTLEEPSPNTALVLVTSRAGALLPTLRSRCQQLAVRAPREADALTWLSTVSKVPIAPELLRFASGAPLRALEFAQGGFETLWQQVHDDLDSLVSGNQDVTQIAKRWADEALADRLTCLDHRLAAHLRSRITGNDDPITSMPLPRSAAQLNISRLYNCLDRVRELKMQLTRTALQRELAVDGVLISLLETLVAARN